MEADAPTIPGFTATAVEAVFAPYVEQRLDAADRRWLDAVQGLERRYAGSPAKATPWVSEEGHRTAERVKTGYESVWGRVSLEAELASSKRAYFEWGDRCMVARTIGRKRVHQLAMAKVLSWLEPTSALEVGFGYGLNLLSLSMQFPAVAFSGVEVTTAGVAAATAYAADARTADLLAPFAVGPLRDPDASRRLSLRQGSAEALPLPDKSVDLVFTILALEQMERIRATALAELARVARHHVVMIEPFADWNTEAHRRGYIARNDYFASTVDGLRDSALTPLLTTVDMPNKLSFRAGLVVAEPSRQRGRARLGQETRV